MPSPLDRVACRNCGANNMLGKDRCWQCGAALPPPEEAIGAPVRYRARPAGPRLLFVGCAVLVLLFMGGVMALVARRAAVRSSARLTERRRLLNERAMQSPGGFSLDGNPTEERAREELRRLQNRLGYTPQPAAPSGNIPLSTGGSLSPETYRKALDALGKR